MNTITSFKLAKGIFGINLMEQGISLLLKGTFTKHFREQWDLSFMLNPSNSASIVNRTVFHSN